MDSVGRNFYFADAAKRKEQPHKIFGRVFRSLLDDVPHCVSNRSLKHYSLDLHTGEIDAHRLAWLERRFHRRS